MQTEWPDLVFLPYESEGRVYNPASRQTYAIAPGRCSCPQGRMSGGNCKHLRELYRRLGNGEATWPLQDPAYRPEPATVTAGAADRAARVRRVIEQEHPDFP